MASITKDQHNDVYALGHSAAEYERLRGQARVWETATKRLLDQVGLATGASCLDAGCGPGETMRLLAERVGPAGHVLGLDADAALGAMTKDMLHAAGYGQCAFQTFDLTADEPIPGGPFDLVYARLVLFHLPGRVAVLRRLWDAVGPGRQLVIQDYDLTTCGVLPPRPSVTEIGRVIIGSFTAVGCDVQAGTRLPLLFAEAGVGTPDGTDVAGRIEPLADGSVMLRQVLSSLRPAAIAYGVSTEEDLAATVAAVEHDAASVGDLPMLWPLLVGAWKRKERI